MSSGNSLEERLAIAKASCGRRDRTDPPSHAELKSAVDSTYFAMYNALCRSNALALARRQRRRHPEGWLRVYVDMDEDTISERFRHHREQASEPVKHFGAAFAILRSTGTELRNAHLPRICLRKWPSSSSGRRAPS